MVSHAIGKVTGTVFVGISFLVGMIIDEKTKVPIVAALSVAGAWGSGLWWLGRKLQTLEDGQAMTRLEYQRLSERLDKLPCQEQEKGHICKP